MPLQALQKPVCAMRDGIGLFFGLERAPDPYELAGIVPPAAFLRPSVGPIDLVERQDIGGHDDASGSDGWSGSRRSSMIAFAFSIATTA